MTTDPSVTLAGIRDRAGVVAKLGPPRTGGDLSEERLTREMPEAAADAMGRAESVVTEWGVRYDGIDPRVIPYGTSRNSERMARMDAATDRETVVRRTVTYSPWETAPDPAPAVLAGETENQSAHAAATGEDEGS